MGYANNLFQFTEVVLLSLLKLFVLVFKKKKRLQIVKRDDYIHRPYCQIEFHLNTGLSWQTDTAKPAVQVLITTITKTSNSSVSDLKKKNKLRQLG